MFRKIIIKDKDHFEKIKHAYRSKSFLPVFKDPGQYPCVMITYTDDDPTRLDYMGEVYNCFVYIEDLKEINNIIEKEK